MDPELYREIERLKQEIKQLRSAEHEFWVTTRDAAWVGTANTPLTSTSWDGDAYSTTAKTLIDLSAVFSVPAGVRAVSLMLRAKDSGSASGACFLAVSPNNVAGEYPVAIKLQGLPNDVQYFASGICPCDANGDIYYQILATGASTLDAWIEIWGYLL